MDPLDDANNFRSPVFIIDEQLCRANIRAMIRKAHANSLLFRPHFKTHQSPKIGEWFRTEGVTAITVSSVTMACLFADAGWDDITIAFPLNIREIDIINRLAAKIQLNVLFDMPEQAAALAGRLSAKTGFFIKIDVGYHRSGLVPDNRAGIGKILTAAENSQLRFRGFLTHPGQTYHAESKQDILCILKQTIDMLSDLKKQHIRANPGIIASTGDTPSCSLADDFHGIDEIRPGNFVFYDLMQLRLESCRFEQIAAAVVCPVVSVYPARNEALIYGGAVHLSKESLTNPDGSKNYGLIVPFIDGKWRKPEGNDYLVSLSQEHGIFKTDSNWAGSLKPGDLVAVIPVHSCLVADLFRNVDCLTTVPLIKS